MISVFEQSSPRKAIFVICLLLGVIGFLGLSAQSRYAYAFNIHNFDHSSGDELKSVLLNHVPLGSKFEDVTKFLDENGFHAKFSSIRGQACGENYYVGSKGIAIITCTNFNVFKPTGWAIFFEFNDQRELNNIEIIGWPT